MLALISALFSATAAIVQKKVLFKEKVLGFTTVLAIFNLVLVIPFFFLINLSNLSYSGIGVLFIKSLLEAAAFFCIMASLKNLEISKTLPLLVLTPGLVAFFAFIFLGESLTNLESLGMIFLLIGTYVLELKEKEKIFLPAKSVMKAKGSKYILIALILMTIKSILDKTILSHFNVPVNTFMAFQHLFLAVIFITAVLFLGRTKEFKSPFKNSLFLIILIAIFTIGYRYTEFQAIKVAPVALVLSLKRISVFFAVLIGGKIFKEKNLVKRVIATAIMILGSVLIING